MQFTGHVQKIRCIAWFDNDMGFTSCGMDGSIYFYDLYAYERDAGKRNQEKDFGKKETRFTSVVNLPGRPYEFVAVGSDKAIATNATNQKKAGRSNTNLADLGYCLSQLSIYNTGKVIFAGVGDEKLPGSV